MKNLTLITALLLSSFAMAQNVPKGAVSAEIRPEYFSIGRSNEIYNPNQSDTVSVYMLVGQKTFGDAAVIPMLTQRKGYSVTPRMAYNSLLRASYLDLNKKPLGDLFIVWMSVPRKDECTCK